MQNVHNVNYKLICVSTVIAKPYLVSLLFHILTETVKWFVGYIKSPLMALCKLTLFWFYYFIMNIKIETEVFIDEF